MRQLIKINNLIGRTVKKIEEYENEICFHMEDVKDIWFYHDQDCCESVRIFHIKGSLEELQGKTIESATESLEDRNKEFDYHPYDSYTWTTFTFKTKDNLEVEIIWLGESNGYYSESIYISEE